MTDTAVSPTVGAAGATPAGRVAASTYLSFLPSLYQYQMGGTAGANFVGRFLLAFQKILTGVPAEEAKDDPLRGGLDGKIDRLHLLFDPDEVPADFMEWLAGWVALDLRADLTNAERRELLRSAVQLYHRRGTKSGLEQAIRIHTRLAHVHSDEDDPAAHEEPVVVIEESAPEMRVGNARVGDTTAIGGGPPHFFRVTIWDPRLDAATLRRMRDVVSAVIEMEKPAHTVYTLHVSGPTMKIGLRSTIGRDTLITADRAISPQPANAHG